jgi:threonine synthase
VVLGTAHPAKFPEAIKLATGLDVALPAHMGDLMQREEKMLHIDSEIAAVKSLVDSLA